MPTDPLKAILDRDLSKATIHEPSRDACALLTEIINHGTNFLLRCKEQASIKDGRDLAILILYRQILELSDSITVMISESCVASSVPLIRSLFEAYVSLEYLLESESEYEKRSIAFIVCWYYRILDVYTHLEDLVNKTKDASAFKVGIKGLLINKLHQNIRKIQADKEFIQERALNDPNLEDAIQEYRRKTAKRPGRPIEWYSLYGGPDSLAKLSAKLGRESQYYLDYSLWSRYCHAGDPSSLMDGNEIRRIRELDGFMEILQYSISFLIGGTRLLAAKFKLEDEVRLWLIKEDILIRLVQQA
jgi:hypothetical protein